MLTSSLSQNLTYWPRIRLLFIGSNFAKTDIFLVLCSFQNRTCKIKIYGA